MRTVQTIAVIAGLLVSLGASPRNAIEPLPRDLEIQLALSETNKPAMTAIV